MEPDGPDTLAVLTQLRRGTLEHGVLAHLDRGPSDGQDMARALSGDDILVGSEGTLSPC
jgi:PadR family transcriptional regulator PadR